MKRGDPDYHALYLGNHVLGGSGFTSRLVKRIRVENGLAYSVYSYFLPMREAGPFMAGLQTRRDQTDKALSSASTVCRSTTSTVSTNASRPSTANRSAMPSSAASILIAWSR